MKNYFFDRIYFAHDTTIVSVLNMFGLFDVIINLNRPIGAIINYNAENRIFQLDFFTFRIIIHRSLAAFLLICTKERSTINPTSRLHIRIPLVHQQYLIFRIAVPNVCLKMCENCTRKSFQLKVSTMNADYHFT